MFVPRVPAGLAYACAAGVKVLITRQSMVGRICPRQWYGHSSRSNDQPPVTYHSILGDEREVAFLRKCLLWIEMAVSRRGVKVWILVYSRRHGLSPLQPGAAKSGRLSVAGRQTFKWLLHSEISRMDKAEIHIMDQQRPHPTRTDADMASAVTNKLLEARYQRTQLTIFNLSGTLVAGTLGRVFTVDSRYVTTKSEALPPDIRC